MSYVVYNLITQEGNSEVKSENQMTHVDSIGIFLHFIIQIQKSSNLAYSSSCIYFYLLMKKEMQNHYIGICSNCMPMENITM